MNNVVSGHSSWKGGPNSSGPTDGGSELEQRISRLEESMTKVREDVASIKATLPSLATAERLERMGGEIARAETSIIKWIIGLAIACAGLSFAAAKYMN